MAHAKRGRATHAVNSADVCVCGHPVSAHDANEVCRHGKKGVSTEVCNGASCTSVRTEGNPSA